MRKFLMTSWVKILILSCLIVSASGLFQAEIGAKSIASSKSNSTSSNELLIQFKPEINAKVEPVWKTPTGYHQFDSLNSIFQLKKIIPLYSNRLETSVDPKTGDISSIYLLKFADGFNLSEIKKSYEKLKIINFAEYNYYYFAGNSISQNFSNLLQSQLEETDPHIHRNQSTIIGIIDTGIEWGENELISNVWTNQHEKLDGKDNDGNGFVDDTNGWNFVDPEMMHQFGFDWEALPFDYSKHGTRVAAVINQIGNYCPQRKKNENQNQLMILKAGIKSPDGNIIFSAFSAAQAIIYAVDHTARVINLSWGGNEKSRVLHQAIHFAESNRCTVIAAAGDGNSPLPFYPAAFEDVLAVTATEDDDKKFEHSNYGYWIDIAAPGFLKINSPDSDTTGFEPSGTNIAAACVSGLAGLLLSCEDIPQGDSLKQRIVWSSENIYHKNKEFSGQLGAGRINVLRAINEQYRPNIIIQKINSNAASKANMLYPVNITALTGSIRNLSSRAQNVTLKLASQDPYLIIQSRKCDF